MWDFSYEVITKACEGNECCKVPWVLPWVQSRCSPPLTQDHTSAISQCYFSWDRLFEEVSDTFFWQQFSSLHSQARLLHRIVSGRCLVLWSIPLSSFSFFLPAFYTLSILFC